MTPPPKCLYEILDVSRTATDEQLKKAYRTQALMHHPDKNPDARDEAEETFKLIQHAYTVLSDPHERAWYDAHRSQILRGVDVTSGEGGMGDAKTGAASATKLDLFSYFSATAYSGMTGEHGLFSVFAHVFDTLAREEDEDDESEYSKCEVKTSHRMPPFGGIDAEWSTVREFYASWEGFSSVKTFAFADKWNLADAPSRDYRRAMERENKRERAKVRKEFNSTVRELVSFVKKRDPRISRRREQEEQERIEQEARAKVEEELKKQQRKVELEQARLLRDEALDEDGDELDEILANIALDERIDRRQRRAERRRKDRSKRDDSNGNDSESENCEVEESVSKSYSGSNEDNDEESENEGTNNGDSISNGLTADVDEDVESDESAEVEVLEELYCAACRKSFRTAAQKCDHERSKKHKSNVGKLQREVLDEEAKFGKKCGIYNGTVEASVGDVSHDADDLDEALLERILKGKRKKKSRKRRDVEERINVSMSESMDEDGGKVAEGDTEENASTVKDADSEQRLTDGLYEVGDSEDVDGKKERGKTLSKKMKRRLREREKKSEQGGVLVDGNIKDQKCNKCGASFPSRTKLMNHVRDSGHALHVGGRN